MQPWWTEHQAALIGAIGGGGLGTLAGMLGGLAGWLAPRGKGKGPVLGAFALIFVVGVIALVGGVYAVSTGQPYHVWYPLVLGGGLMALIMGVLLPVIRLRYRQAEHRRLDAEELRRG